MKKKIALLCESFPREDTDNPGFPFMWELAKALKARGHELLIIAIMPGETENQVSEVLGMKVIHLPLPCPTTMPLLEIASIPSFAWQTSVGNTFFQKAMEELESFQPDVIECQEFHALSIFFGASRQFPLVTRCHGPLTYQLKNGWAGKLTVPDTKLVELSEALTILASDAVISNSNDNTWRLSEMTGLPAEKFSLIRNPLTVPDQIPARTRDTERLQVFFWGNICTLKGTDLLAGAFCKLASEFPNLDLVLGGADLHLHGEPEALTVTLKRLFQEKGLTDRVTFLGPVNREQIIFNVVNSDLCVLPSRYETAGYVCLEAMSLESPVVAARVGGMQEYCLDKEHGLLFEPGNADDLAEKIRWSLKNPEEMKRLGKNGRRRVLEICSPQTCAEQTEKVYTEAIDAFSKRSRHDPFDFLMRNLAVMMQTVSRSEMVGYIKPTTPPPTPPPPSPKPANRDVTEITSKQLVKIVAKRLIKKTGSVFK